MWTAGVKIDVRGTLQRRNRMGSELESMLEGCECFLLVSVAIIGHALHRPKLRIVGELSQCRTEKLKCGRIVTISQCRSDACFLLSSALGVHNNARKDSANGQYQGSVDRTSERFGSHGNRRP